MRNLVSRYTQEVIEIYKDALSALKPDKIVKNTIAFEQNSLLIKDNLNTNNDGTLIYDTSKHRLHVIGGGKCALTMAQGIAEVANQARVTDLFSHGFLSVPIVSKPLLDSNQELSSMLNSIQVECRFGSKNNLPDHESVLATNHMFDNIVKACQVDRANGLRSLFIVLISGGGSACLTSPRYVSLEQKLSTINELVQRGANIVELNTVRRHFSNIKGGGLAKKILDHDPQAQIVSLIISDVIDDPVEFIASGPTYLESSLDHNISMEVMNRYGLTMPAEIADTGEQNNSYSSSSVINKVIGNNHLALNLILDKAQKLGYKTRCLGHTIEGDTQSIVKRFINNIDEDFAGYSKALVVGGGEATVTRLKGDSWGVGGRTQEMALDYIIDRLMQGHRAQNVDVFLAASTDGQDGPTNVAACSASLADLSCETTFSLEQALQAKRDHDSLNFWLRYKPDWLISTGSTGTNVMDLYFLARIDIS